MTDAQIIEKKIKKAGLKKKFVAKKVGIDPDYLSMFFSKAKRKRNIPKRIADKLFAFLALYS